MESSTELVSFVLRAENRVDALQMLGDGAQTRRELQSATGIPRATLSRILADFGDRDLVRRDGHEYRTTHLGDTLARELASLFDAVETAQAVQAVEQWLPLEEFEALDATDALTVTLPTAFDPMAPVKRAAAVVGDSAHVRAFCYSVLHAPILAEARAVVDRDQQFEAVIARGVFDVVAADPELATVAREVFESAQVTLALHDGTIEPQLIVADDVTMLLVADDDGAIRGLVESDDETVGAWADRTFEAIRADAEPVAPDEVDTLLTT